MKIDYFKEEEFIKAKKQKRNSTAKYLAVLGVYVIISIGLFLYYRTLPYLSPKIQTVKAIHYPLSCAFSIFSFIYLSIAQRRINSYYKFCFHLLTARRETSTAVYLENEEKLFIKDGVDCKALIFLEWNKFKKDYYERRVFVFFEKEFPVIPEKAEVEFVTQGNFLISYKIIKSEEV